ncbi:hypothetical protein FA15DRAFT_619857 [Coprinopsis marcescibilis]|uniref:Uncharacterized protein n=1 Tax=Coprinopsis marcescibilis TaxID=230819 RepID=A0A5C3KW86_COPMA|nr:hypothetical protein FA15DRAFT_619857 [Coprinopsis marcescibilis]
MATIAARPDVLPPAKPDLTFARKPTSKIAIFFWRWRMWFEATFVLSMLEPWEKILLITLFAVMYLFVMSAIVKYFPRHLTVMQQRAMYYLWGQEGDVRLVWQWLGFGDSTTSGAGGLLKEL